MWYTYLLMRLCHEIPFLNFSYTCAYHRTRVLTQRMLKKRRLNWTHHSTEHDESHQFSSGIANNAPRPLLDQIVWPPEQRKIRHTTLADVKLSGTLLRRRCGNTRRCLFPIFKYSVSRKIPGGFLAFVFNLDHQVFLCVVLYGYCV